MVGSRRVGACGGWCCKNCPSLPEINTGCGPREIRHGGGPERDLAAADGDADWAAGILVTGIVEDWAAFGQDPGFSQAKPWLTDTQTVGHSLCENNSIIEAPSLGNQPARLPMPLYTCTTLLCWVVVCHCITAQVGIVHHCSNLIALPPAHHQPK